MACEGIEDMLCNMWMLADLVASSFEHHLLPKLARYRFSAIRGIQDGQSPIHCLCQLRKNSGISSLSREGTLKIKASQNLESSLNKCGEAGKEAASKEAPVFNSRTGLSIDYNRGRYRGEFGRGNSGRLQIVLGHLTVNSAKGEAAKGSTVKGNYRGQ
jgi:hypothetical protein